MARASRAHFRWLLAYVPNPPGYSQGTHRGTRRRHHGPSAATTSAGCGRPYLWPPCPPRTWPHLPGPCLAHPGLVHILTGALPHICAGTAPTSAQDSATSALGLALPQVHAHPQPTADQVPEARRQRDDRRGEGERRRQDDRAQGDGFRWIPCSAGEKPAVVDVALLAAPPCR